jgi:hypothetical protein
VRINDPRAALTPAIVSDYTKREVNCMLPTQTMETSTVLGTTDGVDIPAALPFPSWITTMNFVISAVVIAVGTPGNALIVVVYSKRRQLNRVLILILATIDLTGSTFVVPSYIFVLAGKAPLIFVQIWAVILVFISTMSIWMLDCIAIEYHRAICRPLTPQWSRSTAVVILLTGAAWSVGLSVVGAFDFAKHLMNPLSGIYAAISLSLMIVLYSRIVYSLIRRRKIGPAQNNSSNVAVSSGGGYDTSVAARSKKPLGKFKSARMLAMTTMVFALCFFPVYLCSSFLNIRPEYLVFLTFPNYAVNVIVYSVINKNFRDDVVKAIKRLL